MKKVMALGEILLRLSPPRHQTLLQASSFDYQFGGSEVNVLSSLRQFGYPAGLISALPDNDLGQMAQQFLFAHQIDQTYILQKGERLGIYYYQKGFASRSSRVLYDRKHSAFSLTKIEDYDLDAICDEMCWLHISGITVALNPEIYDLAFLLMKKAKSKGIPVSFDLNYRESLWSSFAEARVALAKLVALADVCIGLEPLALVNEKGEDIKDQLHLKRPYRDRASLLVVLKEMTVQYGLQYIAFTERQIHATDEYDLKGYLYDGKRQLLYETEQETIHVLDRIGTGDAFTAGIIYGLLQQMPSVNVLEVAMANFIFKHTIEGDINLLSKQDLECLKNGEIQDIQR